MADEPMSDAELDAIERRVAAASNGPWEPFVEGRNHWSGDNFIRVGGLDAEEKGEADALVVAKLDRLSRSMTDFTRLMERSWKKGWALVALDLGVDTTTPAGEMIANSVANFSQFERRLIGQRTKDALAVKKAQGVQLGRPRVMPDKVVRRIEGMRNKGVSIRGIAEALNDAGVPTAHGGQRWYASTVQKVLGSRTTT